MFLVLVMALGLFPISAFAASSTIGGALGIDPKIAMLLVGVVVTAYVVFGGIWAAIKCPISA